ncbi:hypothetical protein ACFV9C_38560 [Kribbella sp. NPDC059898]|uniref:hypothetical protein n=1 Tax=Kribbella sp. NPDC059898 TaxID=3346995 RepID=UPI00364FB1C7
MPEVPVADAAIVASLDQLDSPDRRAAVAALYDALSGPLYGVALGMSACPEKAQTICLQVFSYLCRNHSEYDPKRESLVQWATQLAHRFAVLAGDEHRTSDLLRSERLSDEQRHDLAQAYFGGLTYYEIARHRGTEPQRVAETLSAGLRSLSRPAATDRSAPIHLGGGAEHPV